MSGEEDLTARIVRLYQAERMSLDAIAAATGFSRKKLRRALTDAGVQVRGSGPIPVRVTAEQGAAIAAARDAGGQPHAAAISGLSVNVVRRVLRERDAALKALCWAWEGLYQITAAPGGQVEAWRMDGTGSVSASTVEGLRDAIREDWPKYADGIRTTVSDEDIPPAARGG